MVSRIQSCNWIQGSTVDQYFNLIEDKYDVITIPHNFIQSINDKKFATPIATPDKTDKKIIIAINPGAHWLLGLVEPASATIKIYDSLEVGDDYTDTLIKQLQTF